MDNINSEVILDNLVDYSQICDEQQKTIRRLLTALSKLLDERQTLQREVELLKEQLNNANKDKHDALVLALNLKNRVEMLSKEIDGYIREILTLKDVISNSSNKTGMLNGSKSRVSKELFVEAYEVSKDIDSLAELFDVLSQTIRNYIKRYIKE